MKEFLFQNISELSSPVGAFVVSDGIRYIPFSIKKNGFNQPYEIYDSNNKSIVATLTTDTNYTLVIDMKDLKIGQSYKISCSSVKLERFDSDECTEAMTATLNGWSVGIGMHNPNEEEELRQAIFYSKTMKHDLAKVIVAPPSYDETKMRGYYIEQSSDSTGYTFKVLDTSLDYIYFEIAWIKNVSLPALEYEAAISFWLT